MKMEKNMYKTEKPPPLKGGAKLDAVLWSSIILFFS